MSWNRKPPRLSNRPRGICPDFLGRLRDTFGRCRPRCKPRQPSWRQSEKCQEGFRGPEADVSQFPVFPPPPPQEIQKHRSDYVVKLQARLYRVPHGVASDTPLYALYRIYEYLIVDHVIGYRNQLEYFWKQKDWSVQDIPDTKDNEPSR